MLERVRVRACTFGCVCWVVVVTVGVGRPPETIAVEIAAPLVDTLSVTIADCPQSTGPG